MNPEQLQAAWLANNKPSVTIEPIKPRTVKEVNDALKQHKLLSQIRKATVWPKATTERSKAAVTTIDPTMYDYGD